MYKMNLQSLTAIVSEDNMVLRFTNLTYNHLFSDMASGILNVILVEFLI